MKPSDKNFLKRAEKQIRSVVSGAEVILYGSRARGGAEPLSDWDLLILLGQPLNQDQLSKLKNCLYDLELETNTVLSSIVRTRAEWDSPRYAVLPFRQAIEREGVLL